MSGCERESMKRGRNLSGMGGRGSWWEEEKAGVWNEDGEVAQSGEQRQNKTARTYPARCVEGEGFRLARGSLGGRI